MVENIRTCRKGVGEVVVMEIVQVEVRTRAMAAEDGGKEKRRKVSNGDLRLPSSTLIQITDDEDGASNDPCASTASLSSGGVPASCCSSNGSTEELKVTDLEEGNAEIGAVTRINLYRRSSKPMTEFKAESGELETTKAKPPSRRTVPAEKMPPAAELEDFFAAAEDDLRKRFIDRYNYDIVSDTPLKGRFEWVQLKQ